MAAFDCTPHNTVLLLIDVQERFQAAIPDIAGDGVCGANCARLLEGAGLLEVPVLVSQQYPQGLGPTLPELARLAGDAPRFDKTHFSCGEAPELAAELRRLRPDHVILAGIEAHVCVLATAADLLQDGYQVLIAADAVASRRDEHRELGLAAARQLGALVLPVESILLRLQRQAGVGCFKALSRLIR